VAATEAETLTVDGLTGERVAGLLTEAGLPFSELRSHRASLEEAYMELTRDSIEFGAVEFGEGGSR
jgi:ABC-2 type transport system ATP-binding protein